jgi:hypothetical protein
VPYVKISAAVARRDPTLRGLGKPLQRFERAAGVDGNAADFDEADAQGVSTAWSTAPRKSGSGTAPSNWTRSLITTFGTPITWYARESSGNSVASITVERTRSDATDMCCARRTARGQCGQVGVEKTLMSTSVASARNEANVSSASAGAPVDATMIASIKLLNS